MVVRIASTAGSSQNAAFLAATPSAPLRSDHSRAAADGRMPQTRGDAQTDPSGVRRGAIEPLRRCIRQSLVEFVPRWAGQYRLAPGSILWPANRMHRSGV